MKKLKSGRSWPRGWTLGMFERSRIRWSQAAPVDSQSFRCLPSGGDGLEQLREGIYKTLDIVRVYTKPPGGKADLTEPSVVRRGSTVGDVAETVHKDFARNLKYAQVWGSGKFDGQRVRRDYILQDGNIVELHI